MCRAATILSLCYFVVAILSHPGAPEGAGIPNVPGNPEKLLPPFARMVETKTVDYKDPANTTLEGLLAYPSLAGPFWKLPAVIIFHQFTGRTELENQKAVDLAKMGYVAFAADTYGKGVTANSTDGYFGLMGQMLAERTTTLRGRILAAFNLVKGLKMVDPERIGSIGYCYGGLCTLDLARFDVGLKAGISFHGTLDAYPGDQETTMNASVQVHTGDIDPFSPWNATDALLGELRQKKADWQLLTYANASHAFTVPTIDSLNIPGAAYNPIADRRSWSAAVEFLEERLQ